jgi:SAM-dependent methyltransferase
VDADPAAHVQGALWGHVITTMIALGHRTGLLEALVRSPGTAAEVAGAAGLDERAVAEWLGAMVTAGIVEHDAGGYAPAPGYEPLLVGERASSVGPTAVMLSRLTAMLPEVARGFVDGGGIPASEYARRAGTEGLGATRRGLYREQFVDGFLGAVPGLPERLREGARVLDVGCGTGQVAGLVADAFPRCTVLGVDVVPEAVEHARAEHGGRAAFGVADVTDPGSMPAAGHDVVLAVDVIHDLGDPAAALRGVRRALAPDGWFVMVDTAFPDDLDALVGDPVAGLAYGISVLHCLPVSRSGGGAGTGAMWGRERVLAMLDDAGFATVTTHASPRPQNLVYCARPSP